MEVEDLPPSLLTSTQRRYLLGEEGEEWKGAKERAVRNRIRERFKAGLYDLALLSTNFEDRDRRAALADIDADVDGMPVYVNWAGDILTLLFAGFLDSETNTEGYGTPEELLNSVVGRAIEYSFPRHGLGVEGVTVEITIDRGEEFDTLSDEDLAGQPLPVLQQMLSVDEITGEEFDNIVRSREDLERVGGRVVKKGEEPGSVLSAGDTVRVNEEDGEE